MLNYDGKIINCDISDHYPCLFSGGINVDLHNIPITIKREFKPGSTKNINHVLKNNDWTNLLHELNINSAMKLLDDKINTVLDFYAPL